MLRATLPAIVLVGVMAMPPAGYSEALLELKSVTVELPYGDATFPPGPGVEAVSRNCIFCHSAGMVLYQPALSKPDWTKIVDKMIDIYKAPVMPDDIPAIIDYLTDLEDANEARDVR
jgi:cytochrome c5